MKIDTSKKYNIIYADPPWSYSLYKNKKYKGLAANHYQTMSKQEIFNLNVSDIAEKDCMLFMWVTFPCLEQGLETIKRWGFNYKTIGFNWVKKNKKANSFFWGCGHYTRSNSELCLIATKGRIKRVSRSVHSVIDTPIESHSKKPTVIRDKIVELVGDLPRIELFAREKVTGWDSWGNEVIGE